MVASTAHLRNLVNLAREPSSDKRRELLRQVTDLFLEASDGYSARETEHFNDIMMGVARKMEAKVRRELSQRLSLEPNAPHGIIMMLANDKIEVAGPILEHSSVLEDVDLLEVIRRQGQDHLRAISTRETVSAQVVDALVSKGDDRVLVTLVNNDGATISRNSMERIVARAENNEALHQPLVARRDVTPELLNEMFWFVSSSLRLHIMKSTADMDAGMVDSLLASAKDAVVGEIAAENANMSQAERFIIAKKRLGLLKEELLVELLTKRQFREFIFGLAHLTDLDIRTAQRIFYDPGCEALAIACKAKNFSQANFATLLSHTKKSGGSKEVDSDELLELYRALSVEDAIRTMRFWRVRAQSTATEAPRELAKAS